MSNIVRLKNSAGRRLSQMFGGFFVDTKHDHFADFGYPASITFKQLYQKYRRNGIATAAIDKTILKTWQDNPFLQEFQRDGTVKRDGKETELEKDIRMRFDDLRIWSRLAEADRRSLVGQYSAVILRIADGKPFHEPVSLTAATLDFLIEIIPAWEGQLTISGWETDPTSDNYGQPKLFQFTESQVTDGLSTTAAQRQFSIHPDRVLIWSRDGTLDCKSLLEPGYNDLIDMEKIKGAGGEGFWKNAKSAPVLELDDGADISTMAETMGCSTEDIADKMNSQVSDWQTGFDKLLMLQGMKAKSLAVTLPSPEHFFSIALQSFAASIAMPVKILVGSQTGERASTEDANEWNQTNMSRRNNTVRPNIMALVNRLEKFGILEKKDWFLDWSDLTEASTGEKIERVVKMADVNQKMKDDIDIVFTGDEMRAVAGYEPLSEDNETEVDPVTGLPVKTGDE